MQRPYDTICLAARVLDNPRATWPEVFAVIQRVAGSIPPPFIKALKKAHGEFRSVPRSRALGF